MDPLLLRIIEWVLVGFDGLLMLLCCITAIRFGYKLFVNLHDVLFRGLTLLTISMLTMTSISIFANFVVVVLFEWEKESLQNALSIPWRICYALSLIFVLLILCFRLYIVFKNTVYSYSKNLWIFISTLIGMAIMCHFVGSTLQLQSSSNVVIGQALIYFAVFTYIFLSILVVCLFIHSLLKVK